MKKEIAVILEEVNGVFHKMDEGATDLLLKHLQSETRVFIVGEGRSGFMAKAFAMRLMHLGLNVYVVGETITPSIAKGDLIIAISGSGSTKSVISVAEKGREIGCRVFSITTNDQSDLAHASHEILLIPAATKNRLGHETKSIQPLSSLFDQCVHVLCDSVCLDYSLTQSISHELTYSKHSNVE
ncbi:3-hexulose-6-phosphate isomerase [Peribacillus sp. Bi96]|uniref:6-phospho-3-hexuloisomerase n=1 Tax=unclassified Peribacillus TaxID=2675266 RepID=UPI001D3C69E4|nr:6-phospho-3-hexuloisomerase [Peribacillus sp. Bi96]CAH0295566.1 3-hexulose-6-phosphate isomerase [Peribacillus sp. Bi96]